ncbi:uncharacterized protein LOC131685754 [Topomyia yanbarensis]|uniref:uncharacterized protein LOC131685754 n=1 Tax=Topomyia yanbarensis TaxID=2498891 RepID=UPI00273BBE0D|nr:uncharacterized protein LOC131685754 [Topomyia yanbarensis]XP_058825678.1 uncharacterized protein LOC131685754 [Topomyia yanbarensis]XP_058825687.1 uncharacterized protein LOC131685754 [Topomyia yanbarensis]XP_058825694.1 uncharacterized protein LOC131685754 [Topomyia yanbarensis]XP_058825702.1 uncharacterized protein LOC131685754 [Topomyia yanbarensis]XP_058825709.1 uncharacterized protein LOC131685754 [Topomyia yanbarensis]XP_058825717.1 uncharacterized protein LOC131685754 [Topomyia yan
MQRGKATAVKMCSAQIREQMGKSEPELESIGHKLLNNDQLTLEDVFKLGQRIAERNEYDANFLVVCGVEELTGRLMQHKSGDRDRNSLFVICAKAEMPRLAVFCVVCSEGKTVSLYNDFSSGQIPDSIRLILEHNFGDTIEYKIHPSTEEVQQSHDMEILSLKALETMMINLKPDKRKDFIKNYANRKRSYFGWLKSVPIARIKDDLFGLIKEGYYKRFASDIDGLAQDVKFKEALAKFFDSLPLLDDYTNFRDYQSLLKKVSELDENDTALDADLLKQVEEARKRAFDGIAERTQSNKNASSAPALNIEKQFPDQMAKFNKLCKPLDNSCADDQLDSVLKKISDKLDLDYNKLKIFSAAKSAEKQQDPEDAITFEDVFNDIATVVSKTRKQIDENRKSLEELLSEIDEKTVNKRSLKDGYRKVKEFSKSWESKQARDVQQWAKSVKGTDADLYETLAVMDRANELVTGGHKLRDTQILSVLVFLTQKQNKGQLCQIQTGEGKTTIVSILAAIKALQGEVVDVVTSNPVLASEGVRDRQLFYKLLTLRAATNNADENYTRGKRTCYMADIVYGSIGSFQFDYLRDSFLGLGTRAKRPFGNIILDEVDSMIIDNASHIAKLSGSLPGMEYLKYVYIKIWMELYKAENRITQEFQESLKVKAEELQLCGCPDEKAQSRYNEFKNELECTIMARIKDCIRCSQPTKIDIIPSHIRDYVDSSLDQWIDSAISAKYNYREDEQYVIRTGKTGEPVIQPVDYANTGITMKNTIWQYGLHQFLQLKHNLHLTAESLTSCFISNLGYIKKYGTDIFGLTGTLGSQAERELLMAIYDVGCSQIPTYKEKKFVEISGEILDDDEFGEEIARDVLWEMRKGRSSLVICETIRDAKEVRKMVRRIKPDIIARTYFDEENANVTEQEISTGEVVFATNIAGRGTDFRTSPDLEAKGGLQVYVAFLPCNKRVEDQAFGRTARQGNKGTAKLMIKQSEVEKLGIDSGSLEEIKQRRDEIEATRIKYIKDFKVKELHFQDTLFEKFSALYRKLKDKCHDKPEYQYVLDDLKEFWAFWLEKTIQRVSMLEEKNANHEFEQFELEARETIAGTIAFNPYYSIQQAEHFIVNDQLDKAEQALDHAYNISKNPEILYSVYMKRFEIAIERGEALKYKFRDAVGDLFFLPIIKSDRQYRENAKSHLREAQKAFKKELDCIEQIFGSEHFASIIESNEHQKENILIKHLVSKQQALNLNQGHVDSLIKQIDEHQDGICVQSRISDYFANLKPQNEAEIQIKKTVSNSELSELAAVSANTTYALRVVLDARPEIVTAAQIQIGGGLALFASGCLFPPALPITSAIAGTMITEGLCDIAIELIVTHGDKTFNKEAYIKGKVVSYGIALLTLGINAALQCPKILAKAKNACRWISQTLRKCPYLCRACESLATKFDKLANWFEKMEILAKFSKMTDAEKLKFLKDALSSNNLKELKHLGDHVQLYQSLSQAKTLTELTRLEQCVTSLKQVAFGAVKNASTRVVQQVIMNKVISSMLVPFLSPVKPTLRKHVEKSVKESLDTEKLKFCSIEDIQTAINKIHTSIDFGTVAGIFKDTILSMSKHCNDWRLQLGALAVDQLFTWKDVYDYVKKLCLKINDKLSSNGKQIKTEDVEKLQHQLIEQLTEELFAIFTSATVKTGNDVITVGMSAFGNYKQEKEREAQCLEQNRNFREGGAAGQEEATALSDVIKRPIHIYDENGNRIVIGEQYEVNGEPIKVRYFPPDEKNPTGHYVPFGEDKDWSIGSGSDNNCLFDAVGSQVSQDSASLRQCTVSRIEADPEHYIARQVHDLGLKGIFLVGGRRQVPLGKDHYPSFENRIKAPEKLTEALAHLRNDLNEQKSKADEFANKKQSEQLTHIKKNKSMPQFGSVPDKEEMMMGVMEVHFTDGSKLQTMTVSGDYPFATKQPVKVDGLDIVPSEASPFKSEFKNFRFVDPGNIKGKQVYEVYDKQQLPVTYDRNCAAQKLFYVLGEHMKNNPHLEVKGDIQMAESWYKPGTAKYYASAVVIEASCSNCENILPTLTGAGYER